jgi:hypothetical protein
VTAARSGRTVPLAYQQIPAGGKSLQRRQAALQACWIDAARGGISERISSGRAPIGPARGLMRPDRCAPGGKKPVAKRLHEACARDDDQLSAREQ